MHDKTGAAVSAERNPKVSTMYASQRGRRTLNKSQRLRRETLKSAPCMHPTAFQVLNTDGGGGGGVTLHLKWGAYAKQLIFIS